MMEPFYKEDENLVYFDGIFHALNPETGQPWSGAEEADAFVAALPESEEIVEEVPSIPQTLSKVAFMDHAVDVLGGGLTGITRYGEVIKAARASESAPVITAMERYQNATNIECDDTAVFLDILVADADIPLSQGDRDTIIDGWPTF
ncbi:MAG: hypothetical protein AB3N28_09045 [Kordiimonas sp.]